MSPAIFVKLIDGRIVVWDYRHHTQFELDRQYFERLLELSKGDQPSDHPTDRAIVESKIMDARVPDAWGWDILSHIFHVGTQIDLPESGSLEREAGFDGYVEYCASISHKIPPSFVEHAGPAFALPEADTESLRAKTLVDVLMSRSSCRNFFGDAMSLVDLATILRLTFGAVHGEERQDLTAQGLLSAGYRRTSPSGGSMHPSEPYVVVLRVEGLDPGIYHYESHRHRLVRIADALAEYDLGGLLCGQSFADGLSFGVFVTSRFDKMWWKYPHSRAYRVALLDIGCLIQTFQLVSTAVGVQSWPTGYFVDHEINRILGLNTDLESVMFFLGAGYGEGSIAPQALAAIGRQIAKTPNE